MQSSLLVPFLVPALLAGAMAQPPVPSQLVKNTPTIQTSGGFGEYGMGLRDHDGDGWADYAVSASNAPANVYTGRVYVYSGRTSLLIRTFEGDQVGGQFGKALADPGDLNGDGVADLVVGAPGYAVGGSNNKGRVFAFSGATGAVLWTADGVPLSGAFGKVVGATADVTGDGVPDLVVGDPGWGGSSTGLGRVVFVNGATGTLVGVAEGVLYYQSLGSALATDPTTALVYVANGTGKIFTMSPPVGGLSLLTLFQDPPVGDPNTPEMALVRVPTGPGFYLAVARTREDTGGLVNNGSVRLYAGGALPTLEILGTETNEQLGLSLRAMRDLNGDGAEELGFHSSDSSYFAAGRVRVVTQTGAMIKDWVAGTLAAAVLGSIPDVTGDGRGELLQFHMSGLSLTSEARLYSDGLEITTETIGGGGEVTAVFTIDAGPVNGGRVYLQGYGISGASPGLIGPAPWPMIPLNFDAVTDLVLGLVGTPLFPDAIGVLGASGTATTNMALPGGTAGALSGLTLTTAAIILGGPGSVDCATNPVAIAFP